MIGVAGTGKIWMNGKLVEWKDATIHIASHVIHYGSGVFEGARCYAHPRKGQHVSVSTPIAGCSTRPRFTGWSTLDLTGWMDAVLETIRANKMKACYIRPLVCRGYDTLGVNPLANPSTQPSCCGSGAPISGRKRSKRRGHEGELVEPHGAQHAARHGQEHGQLCQLGSREDGRHRRGYSEGIVLDVSGHVSRRQRPEHLPRAGRRHLPPQLVDSRRDYATASSRSPATSASR